VRRIVALMPPMAGSLVKSNKEMQPSVEDKPMVQSRAEPKARFSRQRNRTLSAIR
jgi:hypothetical protein